MNTLIFLGPSHRKSKRLAAVFDTPVGEHVTHFGSVNGKTYIDGASMQDRNNYLKRHGAAGVEDWGDPLSAGALSASILWGNTQSMEENIKDYVKCFGIRDLRKPYIKRGIDSLYASP